METVTIQLAAALCVVVAISAVLRGVTGFGFALAAVPLMSLVMSPERAVVIAVLLQVYIGFHDVVVLREDVDRPSVKRMAIGALIGTPPGIMLLDWLDPDVMRILVCLIVCGALPALMRPPRHDHASGLGLALPAGIAAGFFGGLAAMPGPPAVTYFLQVGAPPTRMRASLMIFFFITSLIALPGLYLSGLLTTADVILSLIAMPVMFLATIYGGRIFARTSDGHYRKIAIVVLVIMAISTGVRGISAFI